MQNNDNNNRYILKEITHYCYQNFNYERFNCNNFNIRYWSWNYRGCWHQTCPPIDTCKGIWVKLIPIAKLKALH